MLRTWRSRAVLAGLVVLVVLAGPFAWAAYQAAAARSALARYHPEEARRRLDRCLGVWPLSVQTHLLASRAARQDGDFDAAERHLREAQELAGGSSDAIALEWALLQAAGGNLGEVEEFLQRRADQEPGDAGLVWEALAEGYIRLYRVLDALACLDHWLGAEPDNLRALELRGWAYQRGKSAAKGAEDLRKVLRIDPARPGTRRRLVQCLLSAGRYSDALPVLEEAAEGQPDDPDVKVQTARCYNMLDRQAEARALLDAVLAAHPDHGLALRTRGQFALADSQPGRAERWLRQAAASRPGDYQAQWLLFQALAQQNKTAEAQAQKRRAEEVRDRSERLGELSSRKLSEQPLDPALHYEMGVLLLRGGQKELGERWLHSALHLEKDYRPAHAVLADFYQRQGDPARAAEHRRQAGERIHHENQND